MRALTIDELLALLRPHHCRYHSQPGKWGPNGPCRQSIIRTAPGAAQKQAMLPNLSDDDVLGPNAIRSIMVNLDLTPGDFGY